MIQLFSRVVHPTAFDTYLYSLLVLQNTIVHWHDNTKELGLRTAPRSKAAQEAGTRVESETMQARPTELLTKPRRLKDARKQEQSRCTCRNIQIDAK